MGGAHLKLLSRVVHSFHYVYEPIVTELECIGWASESFLERVFGGSLQPMLAYFVQNQKLTKKDFKELGDILEGKEKTKRKGGKK